MTFGSLLLMAALSTQGNAAPAGADLRHEAPDAEVVTADGTTYPVVLHLVDTPREQVLAAADVLFFWDGNEKFCNLYFKHAGRWYATGGFVGNVHEFIRKQARLHAGTVVFVTDGSKPLDETRYGRMVSALIAGAKGAKWQFYYLATDAFGEPPPYRDYYDAQDHKIHYDDY